MEDRIETIECRTADELHATHGKWPENFGGRVFRSHGDSTWKLLPSAFRAPSWRGGFTVPDIEPTASDAVEFWERVLMLRFYRLWDQAGMQISRGDELVKLVATRLVPTRSGLIRCSSPCWPWLSIGAYRRAFSTGHRERWRSGTTVDGSPEACSGGPPVRRCLCARWPCVVGLRTGRRPHLRPGPAPRALATATTVDVVAVNAPAPIEPRLTTSVDPCGVTESNVYPPRTATGVSSVAPNPYQPSAVEHAPDEPPYAIARR
jgi:hypothetical protein